MRESEIHIDFREHNTDHRLEADYSPSHFILRVKLFLFFTRVGKYSGKHFRETILRHANRGNATCSRDKRYYRVRETRDKSVTPTERLIKRPSTIFSSIFFFYLRGGKILRGSHNRGENRIDEENAKFTLHFVGSA